MISQIIWWSAIALEVILLLRGLWNRLLRKYPLFYSYIACVLVKEIVGVSTYHVSSNLYVALYWPTELATIVASYAVIIEIFRWSTRHKPGMRHFAQNALLTVFALTVGYACSDFFHAGFSSLTSAAILELGRDLRYVEGGVLLAMLGLLLRYRITLGRNLLGLIIGYSFWVGVNVVNLALWFLPGNEFSIVLRGLLPATYLVALGIWCVMLWSAEEERAKPSKPGTKGDYQVLALETQAMLARTSSEVTRVVRP